MSRALQQSDEFFHAARALGWPVERGRAPCGTCWIEQRRRLPLFGPVRLISRAPAGTGWLAAAARPGPLLLNAEEGRDADLWRAGFWPILTPATLATLPLGPEAQMRARLRQKWRNRLNAAQRAGVTVKASALPADPRHWLLAAEAEQAQRRGYRGWPASLCAAWAETSAGAARLFVAHGEGATLAGAVVLLHGSTATWQVAVSLPEGRRTHAMNALLWEAMCWAAEQGYDRLDLGTIETKTAGGLAAFKLGTGAEPVRLGGTWLHHPVLAPMARRAPPAWAWPQGEPGSPAPARLTR
ncbi:hypothetical protein OCH239_02750 [Roseivivax halodurans JCM 10272]|uniref:BioF2-like acetyltransferase domain-containing protein n=1 Tax=Roseivivax halodurans JCM 10272 TaxID=1449350 RepID=X7EF68_9RHOB|nr:GNAT family N-acetyltransferase [Roseivivax halodurans]ETX14500.1 hypothetical protein OCH239_02750 [Roseivivax halodurans JCM 10272]